MTYQLKQTSFPLLIVSTFVVLGLGLIPVITIEDYVLSLHTQNVVLILLSIYVAPLAILLPLVFFVPRRLSSVNVEWCITQCGLEQRWLQHFLFQKKVNRTIPWSEIDEYVYQPEWRFDRFRLHLHDGTKLEIVHNHDHYKDDFRKFMTDFAQRVEEQNATQNTVSIRQGKKDHVWEIRAITITLIFFAVLIPVVLIRQEKPLPVSSYIVMCWMYVIVWLVLLKYIRRLKG